jgi:hypothetical protein
VVMSWAQFILIPGNPHVEPECPVNHEERGLEVGVTPRPWGAEWCVSVSGRQASPTESNSSCDGGYSVAELGYE